MNWYIVVRDNNGMREYLCWAGDEGMLWSTLRYDSPHLFDVLETAQNYADNFGGTVITLKEVTDNG